MRWLIVLPFARPGLMGMDFRDELVAMGHEVRTFAYRRDNPLYKNRSTKATYQIFILRRLERACLAWRPDLVLVIKGGPVTPGLIRRVKARIDTRFLNFFPDNPLWMIPFDCVEAYDAFFTKERYALRALEQAGLRNLHYLPMYCVPEQHHPIELTAEETRRFAAPISFVGNAYPYRARFVRELAGYPVRLWGGGLGPRRGARGARDGGGRAGVGAGQARGVLGLDPVAEPPPPDERHRGREHAGLRAGRERRRARWWTPRTSSPTSSPRGKRRWCTTTWPSCGGSSTTTSPIPTRRATSASGPASGRSPSTPCATASRR